VPGSVRDLRREMADVGMLISEMRMAAEAAKR
jgi:hypothetical protein